MPTIAIVDDALNISTTALSIALEDECYRVITCSDASAALQAIRVSGPDLVILNVEMPSLDGMELLRRVRETSDVPVILLTGKSEEAQELRGFQLCADDYVRKPFSPRVLIARINALLRRKILVAERGRRNANGIEHSHLYLDADRHACIWKGQPITLTTAEFLILQELARRPGVVKSRDALANVAHGTDEAVDGRSVDSHIKRLRRKFRTVNDHCKIIQTLFGVGYRLQDTDSPQKDDAW
jgi:two-component system response regulator ChvI